MRSNVKEYWYMFCCFCCFHSFLLVNNAPIYCTVYTYIINNSCIWWTIANYCIPATICRTSRTKKYYQRRYSATFWKRQVYVKTWVCDVFRSCIRVRSQDNKFNKNLLWMRSLLKSVLEGFFYSDVDPDPVKNSQNCAKNLKKKI